ncbi:MAG: hypothetical protein KKF56_00040 [Nanoarchaeota archaeon]|nr:hypothetical protein [Nanoarchaeota archaeon]
MEEYQKERALRLNKLSLYICERNWELLGIIYEDEVEEIPDSRLMRFYVERIKTTLRRFSCYSQNNLGELLIDEDVGRDLFEFGMFGWIPEEFVDEHDEDGVWNLGGDNLTMTGRGRRVLRKYKRIVGVR